MKVKDIVYEYSIKLDFVGRKVEQEQKKYSVIGYNMSKLCIDDYNFTSIKHTKSYRGDKDALFNDVSVYDTSGWAISSCDYIKATLYTQTSNEKIAYRRMKKALEKFIYAKHGRYCNAISFLDQIKL
jgi:hypothetical protein